MAEADEGGAPAVDTMETENVDGGYTNAGWEVSLYIDGLGTNA